MANKASRKTPPAKKAPAAATGDDGGGADRSSKPPRAEHVLSAEEFAIHQQKIKTGGPTDGGACLCMHSGAPTKYKEHTCSYRWQCHKKSKSRDRHIFNARSDALIGQGKVETAFIEGSKHPKTYYSKINVPSVVGDWWLTGPKRADYIQHHRLRIPAGANFTKWTWPYWHNAHHMIPKSLFWKTISGAADAYRVMRTALMLAEYNIHHGINVIYSPMDEEVAKALGLPRHLDRLAMKDHPKYNARVTSGLTRIIDKYKRICQDELKENHPDPKPELDRKQLEKLSSDCRTAIIALGRKSPGAPLDTVGAIGSGG